MVCNINIFQCNVSKSEIPVISSPPFMAMHSLMKKKQLSLFDSFATFLKRGLTRCEASSWVHASLPEPYWNNWLGDAWSCPWAGHISQTVVKKHSWDACSECAVCLSQELKPGECLNIPHVMIRKCLFRDIQIECDWCKMWYIVIFRKIEEN